MSFLIDTSKRSSEIEIMDDFSMGGDLFRDTLDKLEIINRFLSTDFKIKKNDKTPKCIRSGFGTN